MVREGSSDWLRAIPSKALGLHLRLGKFLFGAKYRNGLLVFGEEGECPASHCKVMGRVSLFDQNSMCIEIKNPKIKKILLQILHGNCLGFALKTPKLKLQ